VLVLAGRAAAEPETTAAAAVDSYVAIDPSTRAATVADVAWWGNVKWRTPEREAVVDYVERESLVGGAPRRELHELAFTDRSIESLTITVGRFRVPGGFWLIVDGAGVAVRHGDLELAVYGGARSFTNARAETLLTSSPVFLPLAGAAATLHGDVQAKLAYTYTRDLLVLPGDGVMAPPSKPDQYVDAEVLAQLSHDVMVMAAATAGTRYLVTYPTGAAAISVDPTLQTMWLGSLSGYAMVDVRAGDWRISTSLAATRTKVGQLTDTTAAAAITGSFIESSTRALWSYDRMRRATLRYRARVFADGRHAHRAYVSGDWRARWLNLQLGGGADLHTGAVAGSGYVNTKTLLARGSVGVKTHTAEVALGVAAASSIGDELSVVPPDDPNDRRNPYTLEARSYAFLHAFATHGDWFAGFDLEREFRDWGMRGLVQVGWAR
jgi:hypothetical protein